MANIENVLVVGRGAVGGLFGSLIEEKIGENFAFLCDETRKVRYANSPYWINGKKKSIDIFQAMTSFWRI